MTTKLQFCDGSPYCRNCGAWHPESYVQACPSPLAAPRRRDGTVRVPTVAPGDAAPCGTCGRAEPGLVEKAWAYGEALARWTAAGLPVRTRHQIAERLAICQACTYYRPQPEPHCAMCGCPLNDSPAGAANKIAMATERCPLETPRWT